MTTHTEPPVTLIRNVRVFDGADVSLPTSVLIEGAQIIAVDRDLGASGGQVGLVRRDRTWLVTE